MDVPQGGLLASLLVPLPPHWPCIGPKLAMGKDILAYFKPATVGVVKQQRQQHAEEARMESEQHRAAARDQCNNSQIGAREAT